MEATQSELLLMVLFFAVVPSGLFMVALGLWDVIKPRIWIVVMIIIALAIMVWGIQIIPQNRIVAPQPRYQEYTSSGD